jgi:DNA primase large subunit
MIRSEARLDSKRKRLDHRKQQFATATYQEHDYTHRLSLYDFQPTQEISVEEFETWGIDRIRGKPTMYDKRCTDSGSSC